MIATALFALATAAATPSGPALGAQSQAAERALASLFATSQQYRAIGQRDAAERTVDAVARSGSHPLVRAQAQYLQLERAGRAANLNVAALLRRKLGIIERARLVGPFAGATAEALIEPLAATDHPFDASERFAGLAHQVGWQRASVDPGTGAFPLAASFEQSKGGRAVLLLALVSRRARDVALRLGSAGAVSVTLNQKQLWSHDVKRPLGFDQDAVTLPLVAGANLLAVTVGRTGTPFAVRLRVTALNGARLREPLRLLSDASTLRKAFATKARESDAQPVDLVQSARARANMHPAQADALVIALAIERQVHATDERALPPAPVSWLKQLIAQTPTNVEAYAALGDALSPSDPTAAQEAYERALQLNDAHLGALLGLAELKVAQELPHDAARLFARARAVAPVGQHAHWRALRFERDESLSPVRAEAEVLALAARTGSEEGALLAAEITRDRGDVQAALHWLEPLAKTDPYHPERLSTLGAALRAKAESDDEEEAAQAASEAVTLWQGAAQARPHSHSRARALVRALLRAGRAKEALLFAQHRTQQFPERVAPWRHLAWAQSRLGAREAAREALLQAQKLRPQDPLLRDRIAALADTAASLSERFGQDPAVLAALPVSEQGRKLGVEILGTVVAAHFYENGLGEILRDEVIRVVQAERARGLREVRYSYAAGREALDVLVAERRTKTGASIWAEEIFDQAPEGMTDGMYQDTWTRVVRFGALADGDILHLRTRKALVGSQNLFGDFFGLIEPIQRIFPVRQWRVVVEAPSSRAVHFGGRDLPAVVKTARGDTQRYEVSGRELPAIEVEPMMPPYLSVARSVSVSSFSRWEELGAFYDQLVRGQLTLSEPLRALARALQSPSADVQETVRQIYEHVVKKTRYVGIELGVHGWKPYRVTDVYRRAFGDCKDKASLLIALLDAVNVDARMVLVRTADLGQLPQSPPSMWLFNHAIVYLPKLDLYLDGTAEYSGWRELPYSDQGAQALMISLHTENPRVQGAREGEPIARPVTIPIASAEANWNRSRYQLELLADGTLLVQGEERFTGQANAERRRFFADPATWREQLERELAATLPGAQVSAVQMGDLSLAQSELSYRFEARVPHFAKVEGDSLLMPVSLFPHALTASYADRSERHQGVWLRWPWRTTNQMEFHLPAGFHVEAPPSGGEIRGRYLRFKQTVRLRSGGRGGGTLVVNEDTVLPAREIPAAAYPTFRRQTLAADKLMTRTVRLLPSRSR